MKKVILFLIIICLAGGVGFYIFDRESNPQETPKITQTAEASNTEQGGGFDIELPELGVKILKTNEMADITHETISDTGTSLRGKVLGPAVNFKSDRLTQAFKSCAGAGDNAPSVTTVYRLNGTYNPTKPDVVNSTGLLKQFDGFYLEGSHGGSGGYCANDQAKNQQIQTTADQVSQQIHEAFKKAELLQ